MLHLYNTLSRKIEEFTPIHPPDVGLYACGMTVYDFSHIGHGRKYVGDDILRRILEFHGYRVTHIQNVTDVGHLSSDADSGEDKLEKGALKFGKTVWEVAEFFTKNFYDSMALLNILPPTVICKATDHIPEQIELVSRLMENGLAYDTPEAVYFDVSAFPRYSSLFGQDLESKKTGVRSEVETGSHKRHPADFVLWFKRIGRFANHSMHWESPWGDGFPGWHVECSAMSMKYLGEQFDIHTGGIDHMSVHHPNEIAQSEGATGKKPFVRFWVHQAFLMVDGKKMSKSLGNLYTVSDVMEKGFDPLSLRYLYLTSHYRKPLNFTWEALTGAAKSLAELRSLYQQVSQTGKGAADVGTHPLRQEFLDAVNSDMNMPQALAVMWKTARSHEPNNIKTALFSEYDRILGLDLAKQVGENGNAIPEEINQLVVKRSKARAQKDFQSADELRIRIEEAGYTVEDAGDTSVVKKK